MSENYGNVLFVFRTFESETVEREEEITKLCLDWTHVHLCGSCYTAKIDDSFYVHNVFVIFDTSIANIKLSYILSFSLLHQIYSSYFTLPPFSEASFTFHGSILCRLGESIFFFFQAIYISRCH